MSVTENNVLIRSKDSSGNSNLYYPVTKADNVEGLDEALAAKVDKVTGKSLSTNDYTTAEKNKLAGIAEGANKTTVDSALSSSSTNPVQNKVVNSAISSLQTALDGKANSSHGTHVTYSTTAPAAAGTASVGSAATVARSDHVHPVQTSVSGNAGTSSKWATARNINGMSVQGDANRVNYGSCSTAAETAAKTVNCTGFALVTGAEVTVKFTVTNTAASPTLNVNSTGAKAIYYRGSSISAGYLASNRTYTFRYDGTHYDLVGDLDTNTTYGAAGSSLGLVKTGGDVTIADGIITVNDDSHNHVISNIDGLQSALDGKAASSHGTHVSFSTTAPVVAGTAAVGTATTVARSDHVHPAQTSVSGNAGSATKLATARTFRTNLGSTSTASFNGTANVTPGVTGTLPLANGGTGATTAAAGRANLGAAKVFWSTEEPSSWTANDMWLQIID